MGRHHSVDDSVAQSHQVSLDFTNGTFDIGAPPNNGTILLAFVIVEEAYNGTNPTIEIGTPTTDNEYMGSGVVDLTALGGTRHDVLAIADPTAAEQIRITITTSGADAGACRVIVQYKVPPT